MGQFDGLNTYLFFYKLRNGFQIIKTLKNGRKEIWLEGLIFKGEERQKAEAIYRALLPEEKKALAARCKGRFEEAGKSISSPPYKRSVYVEILGAILKFLENFERNILENL